MSRDNFGPPPQQPTMNVDLSQSDDITCERCGNYTFAQVMMMKRLSAIISPTGKEAIVPVPSFACNACGYINPQFMPVLPKTDAPPTKQESTAQKTHLILEK